MLQEPIRLGTLLSLCPKTLELSINLNQSVGSIRHKLREFWTISVQIIPVCFTSSALVPSVLFCQLCITLIIPFCNAICMYISFFVIVIWLLVQQTFSTGILYQHICSLHLFWFMYGKANNSKNKQSHNIPAQLSVSFDM